MEKTVESQINEIVEGVKKELYNNKDKILKEMKKKNRIYNYIIAILWLIFIAGVILLAFVEVKYPDAWWSGYLAVIIFLIIGVILYLEEHEGNINYGVFKKKIKENISGHILSYNKSRYEITNYLINYTQLFDDDYVYMANNHLKAVVFSGALSSLCVILEIIQIGQTDTNSRMRAVTFAFILIGAIVFVIIRNETITAWENCKGIQIIYDDKLIRSMILECINDREKDEYCTTKSYTIINTGNLKITLNITK